MADNDPYAEAWDSGPWWIAPLLSWEALSEEHRTAFRAWMDERVFEGRRHDAAYVLREIAAAERRGAERGAEWLIAAVVRRAEALRATDPHRWSELHSVAEMLRSLPLDAAVDVPPCTPETHGKGAFLGLFADEDSAPPPQPCGTCDGLRYVEIADGCNNTRRPDCGPKGG